MRLRLKDRSDPYIGETRIREGFAFLPRVIHLDLRWFEHVIYEQKYVLGCGDDPCRWISTQFIDQQERLE